LPLALGLPLLIVRWGNRVRSRQPADPSRRRLVGAVLLGGFAGTVTLAAMLSATAAVAELFGAEHPLNVTYALLGWLLLGVELGAGVTVVLLYAILLTLLVGLATAYYELTLRYLRLHEFPLSRQALGLALLALGLLGGVFLISLFVERDASFDDLWWQAGGPMMLIGISLGVTAYAATAVYGRVLAIAVAPTVRRDG